MKSRQSVLGSRWRETNKPPTTAEPTHDSCPHLLPNSPADLGAATGGGGSISTYTVVPADELYSTAKTKRCKRPM